MTLIKFTNMQFFKKLFGKKKMIIVTPVQVQEPEKPILTEEKKEAERKRKTKLLLDSIGKGNTIRMNIDGRSMLYSRKKNEQNNT